MALAPALYAVVQPKGAAFGFAHDVADVLEDLLVAVSWLHVAGDSAGREVPGPLLLHQLVLPLLGLRELCGNDHQAQVNHEEGAHLVAKEKGGQSMSARERTCRRGKEERGGKSDWRQRKRNQSVYRDGISEKVG